jgi:hypothetical protein
VVDGDQRPVGVRPDPHPLNRRRAVAGEGGHLLAGGGQLHRPSGGAGGHHRRDRRRSWHSLGTEAASDMVGDDVDLVVAEPERLGDRLTGHRGALVGVIDRDPVALPHGDRGVQLDRVVVLGRGRVGLIDGHRRGRIGVVEVAALSIGLIGGVDLVGLVEAGMVEAQLHVVSVLVVLDRQQLRRLLGGLRAVGDDDGHDLPAVGDLRRLQDGQLARRPLGERGSVAGPQHRPDVRQGQSP